MPRINLIPGRYERLKRQRRRVKLWIGVGAFAGCATLFLASQYLVARQQVSQLASRVHDVRQAQQDVAQQMAQLSAAKTAQVARANIIVKLRPAHRLADEIQRVFAEVPAGVLLREITAGTGGETARRGPPMPDQALEALAGDGLEMTISGYALNHEELNTLARRLRDESIWPHVTLGPAEREKYRAGEAIAFELVCRTRQEADE
jgi:Tfp pilus assembly protein PilN